MACVSAKEGTEERDAQALREAHRAEGQALAVLKSSCFIKDPGQYIHTAVSIARGSTDVSLQNKTSVAGIA